MTDDSGDHKTPDHKTPDHKTEAERKKQEAAQRLQEALRRKQAGAGAPQQHQSSGGHKNFSAHFSPKPQRRGPRGG